MDKTIRVSDIAKYLGSSYDGVDYVITNGASLSNAEDYMVTFSKNKVIKENLSKKILILVPLDYSITEKQQCSIIKVKNPRLSFAKVLNEFFIQKTAFSIHKSVIIGKNCKLDSKISIGANCYIGDNVQIGANTVINHNVVIFDNTIIGENCYIKSGAIIGEEGLGFDFEDDGTPIRIPHIGNVQIGRNVEIGSNTVIARGTLSSTIIENDVKIDDQVFIAHNCFIGQKTIIVAFAQISGSVKIGEKCWIGPNSSIIQKVSIGDNVTIGIGTIVTGNILDNKKIMSLSGLGLKELIKVKKRIDYGK